MLTTAKFNDDHTHRLILGRLWNESSSKIMFIGLNPSKADDVENDNTVRRLIKFSQNWGFGGFYIGNIYSYIATEPKDMIKYYSQLPNSQVKKLQKANLHQVIDRASICSMTVFCWGANVDQDDPWVEIVIRRFKNAYCFGKTKDGHPKHPLFLASHTQLQKFR
jgi:hypothetical protein